MTALRKPAAWMMAAISSVAFFSTTTVLAQSTPEPASDPASAWTVTANVALATEYRYRGLMQSNRRPAIQGGFDVSHESGFYLGNWNSNISWLGDSNPNVSAPIEMDFYGGFKNTFGGGDWNYDVGVLQYYYPGDYPAGYVRPYTTELYAGIGYGPVFLKYSYAPTNLFGFADSKHSWYADLSANVPLNVWGLTLNAHVGYQKVQFTDASYTDWKLGLTKELGKGFSVSVAYIDTNADKTVYTNARGNYMGKATAWASISKTF